MRKPKWKENVVQIGCIWMVLFFAYMFSSCATIRYDFIGTWTREPGTLTYLNHKHHIKITFPNDSWRVCTGPHDDDFELFEKAMTWKTPEGGGPYHLLVAGIPGIGVTFQLMIIPTMPNISLETYAALYQEVIKAVPLLTEGPIEKIEVYDSKEIQRNERKMWLFDFGCVAKGIKIDSINILVKERDGFTSLLFGGPTILAKKNKDDFWSIIDSYQHIGREKSYRPKAMPTTLTNSLGMKFVYISPGTFLMGSPPDEPGRMRGERQHLVTLTRGFYMQTTEVTQRQWKEIMGYNPSRFIGSDCPVERVSWHNAQEFIRRLNQREGTDKYRLPTEAEWEYACRARSTTAFANGAIKVLDCGLDKNLNAMGWYCGNSTRTHPVAQKKANAWGLYDMHGNVSEWCQDLHGTYPSGSVTDPKEPVSRWLFSSSYVNRGGAWNLHAFLCRSAARAGFGSADIRLGFRLARTP